jgi:Holliday junction DNA helicase RuvB
MIESEFDFENRVVSTTFGAEDGEIEDSLRPRRMEDYIGQTKAKENLDMS